MARVILHGVPLSPGFAIGPLNLFPDTRLCDKRPIAEIEIPSEIAALQKASEASSTRLQKALSSIPEHLTEYQEIIGLQIELVRDPRVLNGAVARIRHKKICASWAVSETIDELAKLFESMADTYLSERAQDIRNIGQTLLAELAGISSSVANETPCILASYDLSAADVMKFKPNDVLGLLTVEGGVTSHTAILARGLKIAAIGNVNELFKEARNGEITILDGLTGEALLGPDESEIARFKARRESYNKFEIEARYAALKPAITRDETICSVFANLERHQELHELERCGAEGIGLYRTEYGWLRGTTPNEEALSREYSAIVKAAKGKPVIFRTLDVGADKILPVQDALHEANPALGLRGIRFCLSRPDLFRIQLRALLRAASHGNMSIMLPMISTLDEIWQTRDLIREAAAELAGKGYPHASTPPLGAMIETPAAVLICQELAAECDFLSLGTNDLLHYLMAIDRNNRHISYLHEPLHPAFLRAIKQVIQAGRDHAKPVSICGELAADPMGTALLLGLGVRHFSAAPRFIPAIKHTLRKLDHQSCRRIANAALAGADIAETRLNLHRTLTKCMESEHFVHNSLISGLIRP